MAWKKHVKYVVFRRKRFIYIVKPRPLKKIDAGIAYFRGCPAKRDVKSRFAIRPTRRSQNRDSGVRRQAAARSPPRPACGTPCHGRHVPVRRPHPLRRHLKKAIFQVGGYNYFFSNCYNYQMCCRTNVLPHLIKIRKKLTKQT